MPFAKMTHAKKICPCPTPSNVNTSLLFVASLASLLDAPNKMPIEVGLVKPKHLRVGATLCCGLQSQSPTDSHWYACVGMDYNPRVQGIASPFLMNEPQSPPKRRPNAKKKKAKDHLEERLLDQA